MSDRGYRPASGVVVGNKCITEINNFKQEFPLSRGHRTAILLHKEGSKRFWACVVHMYKKKSFASVEIFCACGEIVQVYRYNLHTHEKFWNRHKFPTFMCDTEVTSSQLSSYEFEFWQFSNMQKLHDFITWWLANQHTAHCPANQEAKDSSTVQSGVFPQASPFACWRDANCINSLTYLWFHFFIRFPTFPTFGDKLVQECALV